MRHDDFFRRAYRRLFSNSDPPSMRKATWYGRIITAPKVLYNFPEAFSSCPKPFAILPC